MNLSDNGLVRITVGESRIPEPDNVISVLKFGKSREATNELLATCTQLKRKYCAIIEMELRFAELSASLMCVREAVSIHRHDMNARA